MIIVTGQSICFIWECLSFVKSPEGASMRLPDLTCFGRTRVKGQQAYPIWSQGPMGCCQLHRPPRLPARWSPVCLTLKCRLQLKAFFQRTSLSIPGPYGDQSLWACDCLRGQTQERSRWKGLEDETCCKKEPRSKMGGERELMASQKVSSPLPPNSKV